MSYRSPHGMPPVAIREVVGTLSSAAASHCRPRSPHTAVAAASRRRPRPPHTAVRGRLTPPSRPPHTAVRARRRPEPRRRHPAPLSHRRGAMGLVTADWGMHSFGEIGHLAEAIDVVAAALEPALRRALPATGCDEPRIGRDTASMASPLTETEVVPTSAPDRDALAGAITGSMVVALIAQAHRVQALAARAAAAFDRSGAWADDGARTAAAWLGVECRLSRREAARTISLGAAADALPHLGDAWADGQVGAPHVGAMAALLAPRTREALERDEAMLTDHARTLPYEDFRKVLAYWAHLADPDGCEESQLAREGRRRVSLNQSFEGQWFGDMCLDPIGGAIVADELGRIEKELFDADLLEAQARREAAPGDAGDLRRSSAQRRADALVVMATRSRAASGRQIPAPLFTVLVDWPTLAGRVCELANGRVVTPGAVAPWLTVADLERAVRLAPRRVEVSATTRLFSGATRRALDILDRTCTHPYCDLPAAWCQGDHIVRFADGGPTIQENGRLLCPYHNRLRELQRRTEKTTDEGPSSPPLRRTGPPPCGDGDADRSTARPPPAA